MLLLFILWDDWPIFYDFRFKWTATAPIGIHPIKPWLSQLVNFKSAIWTWGHFRRTIFIKILFELGKDTTDTYEMLQTAFRASCMNRESVFDWHMRFKEGRESVRNDERCGRSKEVRTPELISQIKNFMDKNLRVYRDNKHTVWCQCGNCTHNYSRGTEDAEDLREVYPKSSQRRSDRKTLSWQQGEVELINSDPTVLDALVTSDERWINCYDPETKKQSSQWKHAGSPRPKKANQSKSSYKLLMLPFFFDSTGMIYMQVGSHWTDYQQGIVCWDFKGVQEDISSEEANTLQIESVAFPPGQCTSPQLHPSHRLIEQDGHQDSSSDSLAMTFGYSLSSRKNLEAVVMRQLRRWKRLWWRSLTRSHKRTSMGPSRSCWNSTTMNCSRRRLLRRGLEIHVCISRKVPIWKKSGNLFNEPCIKISIQIRCQLI